MKKSTCIISKLRNICSVNSVCYRVQLGIIRFRHLGNNALYLKSAIKFPKHFYNITFNYKYTFYLIFSTALLRRND